MINKTDLKKQIQEHEFIFPFEPNEKLITVTESINEICLLEFSVRYYTHMFSRRQETRLQPEECSYNYYIESIENLCVYNFISGQLDEDLSECDIEEILYELMLKIL